jgi:hypothetical protein
MIPLTSLGVRIALPAEAFIPLMIACAVILVLVFAGSGLKTWKQNHPRGARFGGAIFALVLMAGSIYFLSKTLTQTNQYDLVYKGVRLVGFIEGPLAGGFGAIAAILWGFANQRWLALATGLGIGAALIAKPLVWPLMYESHQWGLMDPEHLSFIGPGVVCLITGLVVARRWSK